MSARISLIAAVAENGVIGKDGDLPWRIKNDWKYFKDMTLGKPVVMGRKCFESIGAPLPDRLNIVITRNPDYKAEGVIVVSSIEEALKEAEKTGAEEIMIGGGEGIYRDTLKYATRLYINEVHASPEGNVFFPPFNRSDWVEVRREKGEKSPGDTAEFTITILERKLPAIFRMMDHHE